MISHCLIKLRLENVVKKQYSYSETNKLCDVCVSVHACMHVCVNQWNCCSLNLEYSIITFAHPAKSREASHNWLCTSAHTHTETHTHHPYIFLELQTPCREAQTHQLRGWWWWRGVGNKKGGGGGAAGCEEGWGWWWVTLRPRLNTNDQLRSAAGRTLNAAAQSAGASPRAMTPAAGEPPQLLLQTARIAAKIIQK